MASEESLFQLSLDGEMQDVYYFQQISHEKDELLFKVPWGGAIIRNSLPTGAIMKFRTVKEYEHCRKDTNKQLWLLLPLKVFRTNNNLFGVYCCPQCDSMMGTNELTVDQDPRQILARLCVHSKVCSTILGDWRNIWEINISPQDQMIRIVCNEHITAHTFQIQMKQRTLLAAIRSKDEIAILYTVTCRQDSPICSSCVTRKCPHVHSYEKYKEGEEEQGFTSNISVVDIDQSSNQDPSDQADTSSESGSDVDGEAEQAEKGKHKNYWVNNIILYFFYFIRYIKKHMLHFN